MEVEEINQNSVKQSVEYPLDKLEHSKAPVLNADAIQVGMLHEIQLIAVFAFVEARLFIVFEIKQRKIHYWNRCEHDVVELIDERLV